MFSGPRTRKCRPTWSIRWILSGSANTPARRVGEQRVVLPGVPQPRDHVDELARPVVALGVHRVLVEPEVVRRVGGAGGDDVPPGPALRQVVERREQPGRVVGLEVRRRRGADQPDPRRHRGDRGQPGERLEAEPAGIPDVVGQRGAVGEEHRVELLGLGAAGQVLVVGDVQDPVDGGVRVPPRGLVVPAGVDEQVELELPWRAHALTASTVGGVVQVRRDAPARSARAASSRCTPCGTGRAACRIGTTWSTNASSPEGSTAGMMLKPSAAPASNQSWIASATCSGVPAKVRCPRPPPSRPISCADGQLLAPGQRHDQRVAALRALDLVLVGQLVRQLRVERQVLRPHPQRVRELGAGVLRPDQLVELPLQPPRLGLGAADHRHDPRQDLDRLGVPADRGRAALEVAVEVLRVLQGLLRGEHRLGVAGGEVLAVLATTRPGRSAGGPAASGGR